ncbi:MAG: 3-deoxy-7-phosphoheptulonate synthase [Elusimicrobia bacterium RIFOXYC2_FULL_34_12]|nr:MAG: 3-deoxy-7-phosphoheptulonate synthase [Elusimicrobia bacterium RIFOXYC2_FULL_34_12]OGS38315.1 MAG: 3-deoxy-7-phosphoheptulonate synthase [Elusimicrobia bacterium RIFOXYD2_FULL_34_30]HAM39726.1 3-deoxy-7-phosphoheptulonate synthase [Elusimicrobiota bacterium]
MILTLKPNTSKKEIDVIVKKIEELGFKPHISRGKEVVVIGVVGQNAILKKDIFGAMDAVAFITPISKPYKLVSREFKKENTVIKINNIKIGGKEILIAAGPCSVETKELLLEIAEDAKESGAKMIRGGAFKPRTSPYAFQGLGERGLKYLAEARKKTGLYVITEVMNVKQVDVVSKYADIIQIGARNMQNYDLLKEVGKVKKPVLLKRGFSATIEEFLMSAEYIMSNGNYNVILCERGIRTFETSTRFTLDLNAIPVIKKLSHLPVFVDPSHGVGVREYIPAMSKAAIACGADGLLIEIHPHPEKAFSDGPQSLLPKQFSNMMKELKLVAESVGRGL